jgi:hypothetical protein
MLVPGAMGEAHMPGDKIGLSEDGLAPCSAPEASSRGIAKTVVVRRVEALFNLADAIEKRVTAATARTDKLTQAILAKAFRGELVPTEAELARREGCSYEPASVLLERIRAEPQEKRSSHTVARRPVRHHRAP